MSAQHQSQLQPADNKFHKGNGEDQKHYWLTPPDLKAQIYEEFGINYDPCPYPKPEGYNGLQAEWGTASYVNPPFGSIMDQGPNDNKPKKKGMTAWVRKSLEEQAKGKMVVLVYPIDKWVLMLIGGMKSEFIEVRNLGDVKWCATEDGTPGKGTGRHIAMYILKGFKVN